MIFKGYTNNLYLQSMMQLLPTEILYWVNPDFNIDIYSNDSPKGCFSEVDLIILMSCMMIIL